MPRKREPIVRLKQSWALPVLLAVPLLVVALAQSQFARRDVDSGDRIPSVSLHPWIPYLVSLPGPLFRPRPRCLPAAGLISSSRVAALLMSAQGEQRMPRLRSGSRLPDALWTSGGAVKQVQPPRESFPAERASGG